MAGIVGSINYFIPFPDLFLNMRWIWTNRFKFLNCTIFFLNSCLNCPKRNINIYFNILSCITKERENKSTGEESSILIVIIYTKMGEEQAGRGHLSLQMDSPSPDVKMYHKFITGHSVYFFFLVFFFGRTSTYIYICIYLFTNSATYCISPMALPWSER